MSIRQTRQEYIASLPRKRQKPTVQEVAKLLALRVKQSLRKRGLVPAKPVPQWQWEYSCEAGTVSGIVAGHTRSEARALIKEELGIKNRRLPQGVVITPVEIVHNGDKLNENQPASAGAA